MEHKFLIHDPKDSVGVAVADISAGEMAKGVAMEDHSMVVEIKALNDVPLGHKIALKDFETGQPVIKYGVQIGLTRQPIAKGEHVHTHNIKSARW